MALRDVFIRIRADTGQAKKETEKLDDQTREAITTYRKLEKQIDKLADNAVQDFKRMTGASKKTGKATRAAFDPAAMLGAVGLGAVAGSFLKDSVAMFGKMERYKTVLTTTLGTSKDAQQAMDQLRSAAASTPFSVDELTGSFIKLANRGMAPTMQEMMLFGDIAASQGKSFDQFTEAVLDATSGEFERLKEFGIKGAKAGGQVVLSFKGVLKEVKNTPDAIKEALLEFGKLKGVAGGMEAISNTLEGRMSNIGDSIDFLKFKTGEFINIALGPLLEYFTDGEKGMQRIKVVMIALAAFVLPALAAAGWIAIEPFLPFIAIAAGVAAALTGIYLIIDDLMVFADGGNSMFGDFLEFLGFDKADIENIRLFLKAVFTWLGDKWAETVKFFKKHTWILKVALALMFLPLVTGIAIIKGFIWLWKNLPGIIMEAIDAITGQLSLLWDALVNTFMSLGSKLIHMLFPIDALVALFDFMKPKILEFVDWIMLKLEPVKEAFKAVKGFLNIGGTEPAKIQKLATGGAIDPGALTIVGEKGPELLSQNTTGTILPNSVFNNQQSSQSNSNIINVYVNGEADESLADKIVGALDGAADRIFAGTGREVPA